MFFYNTNNHLYYFDTFSNFDSVPIPTIVRMHECFGDDDYVQCSELECQPHFSDQYPLQVVQNLLHFF